MLTIRNARTEAAVRELAARTHTGLTEAVDHAVRAALEQVQSQAYNPEAIARDLAELDIIIGGLAKPLLIDDDLYDEFGAPR
jgi:hypothetical protein